MTYIEFFDKVSSENICACLTNVPDRVIYLGDNVKLMKKHIEKYRQFFSGRGHQVEFLFKIISKSNLDNAVQLLTDLVETYDDCVFDITGGEEILMLALGIVYARYPEKHIQIHRFNLRNNVLYDCDKDGNTVYQTSPKLSVEENVKIFGGDVVYGSIDEGNTYEWNLTPDFIRDINLIWSVCRGNVRYWNTVIGIFEAIEAVGSVVCEPSLTTVAKKSTVEAYLTQHRAKYKISKGIIKYLLKYNLLTGFDDSDENVITISYKNEQIKKCLTKAGQALEMKIYITAKKVLDVDGNPVYNDVVNGVVIDWDGEFHDENVEEEYDTENEIDIFMMHDIVPVFVSCKNGIVTAEELYKLNTVAERFGGQYSKKILIATSISGLGEAGKYLRQRAKDMNIRILEDVQKMDDAELEKKLKTLWCN